MVQEIGAYAHTISSYPLIAAVGGIAPRVEDLPGSRSEALQTLQYLAPGTQSPPPPELFEDYRVPLNLLKVGAFIAETGLSDVDDITRIQAHDAEQQTDYLDTLRAYLASNGNISAWPRCCTCTTTPSATGSHGWPKTSASTSTTPRSGSGSGSA